MLPKFRIFSTNCRVDNCLRNNSEVFVIGDKFLATSLTQDKTLHRFSTLIFFYPVLAVFLGRIGIKSERHAAVGKNTISS